MRGHMFIFRMTPIGAMGLHWEAASDRYQLAGDWRQIMGGGRDVLFVP